MKSTENVVTGGFGKSWMTHLTGRVKAWHERRVAIRQLNSMSDRLLEDIGIDRHQIKMAVNRPAALTRITPASSPVAKIEKIKQAA